MNRYYQQAEEAVRATEVHSPIIYSWFGKRSERLPSALKRSLTPRTARGYLLFNLRSQLYADFYCQGFCDAYQARSGWLSGDGYDAVRRGVIGGELW
jgi:hypothetical protein